jgi:hypothetical protein
MMDGGASRLAVATGRRQLRAHRHVKSRYTEL